MPYDPRHVSEGGNRTTTRKSLKAPKGKYRVVLVDTFDGGDCILLTTKFKQKALNLANDKGGSMTIVYVYDDKGRQIHKAGTF